MLETSNMKNSVTALQIFDLDETFFRMPGYTGKKQAEKEELKFDTPYSFYDHPKSLCDDTYHIQLIGPVYEAWKRGASQEDHATMLITHRVKELEGEIHRLLSSRGVSFDFTYFLGRVSSKTSSADAIMQQLPNLEQIEVYEDSIEQLYEYQEFFGKLNWPRPLTIKLYIVDKSRMFRIENFKISEKTKIQLI